MAYDVEGARKAGLSDAEINNYLASKYKYNLAGAREAGVPDAEILTHLLAKDKPKAAPAPTTAPGSAPILSPEEVTTQAEPTVQPKTGLTEQQKKQLAEETAKYEREVPFLQRITDPLKSGFAAAKGILPGVQVANIQNEINLIREGKGYRPSWQTPNTRSGRS
jgi:hypothetical protein